MRNITYSLILLCLVCAGCYDEDKYLPNQINPDSVIQNLYATQNTIPADGQSFTYIVAELPVDAMDSKSTVIFTTTKGAFDNNSKTLSLPATVVQENGVNKRIAKVKLVSTSAIETADITATVAGVTKAVTVQFTNLALDGFLSVSASALDIPADGSSFTNIRIDQPVNILSDYTSVTFTASSGTFENGTRTITKPSVLVLVNGEYQRTVQARLMASKTVETATVEVAIKGTMKSLNIDFRKAYPEGIQLSLSGISIATGFVNSLQITTSLLRAKGVPTIGNLSSVTVVDTNNVSRGSFINYATQSDANGQTINRFTLGNDTYKGKLRIIAIAKDSLGSDMITESEIISQ